MQYVEVQEITITKNKRKGSPRIDWNYDLNGVPFGQVFTYKVVGEVHMFTAVMRNGFYCGSHDTLAEADKALRSEM